MAKKRYVALLRGVNVGGHNKVPMKDLRAAIEALGHDDVVTYIQSGNVVFTAAGAVGEDDLERLIEQEFGVTTRVVVRTAVEMRKAVDGNPFTEADPKFVHVGFMAAAPPRTVVGDLDLERFEPEEVAFVRNTLYLHLPNGLGRAKLPPYVDARMTKAGTPVTVRNWATVTKLTELAQQG